MHEDDDKPYVRAREDIAVRVTLRNGTVRDGWVDGWRGRQVDVAYRTEMGNHVGCFDASDVERV